MPDDFFYGPGEFAREQQKGEQPPEWAELYHSFAFESNKRSNLHLLNEGETLIYAAGNYVHMIDMKTMEQTYLPSKGGTGIGAIAVHPKKTYLVVAEVGTMPNVYVYEFPSLKLYRVLRNAPSEASLPPPSRGQAASSPPSAPSRTTC